MSPSAAAVESALHGLAVRIARRPGLRLTLAVALFAAIVGPYVWSQLTKPDRVWLIDLNVYRAAGRHVLQGGDDLYRFDTPLLHLPFTYPPFPALLAVWLAVVPKLVAGLLWTAAELVVVVLVTGYAFRPVLDRTAAGRPFLLAALAGGMLWLNPVRDGIKFGQVDLFMVGLALADCVARRPRWPRGLLVGLAAAVKLTPALFVPYLWLSGRRRAAYVAVATFVAAQALAQLVIPAGSWDYWTRALFESDRLGSNRGTSNQSIRGLVLRLGGEHAATTLLWVVLAVVVLVVGARRALAAHRAGDEVAAVALVGLLSVALSPVSWIHHMAWLVLVVAVVADDFRDPRRVTFAVALSAFFVLRLPWWGNSLSMHHGGIYPMRLVQDSFGLAVMALIFFLPWREPLTAQAEAIIGAGQSRRAWSLRPSRVGTGGTTTMTILGSSRTDG